MLLAAFPTPVPHIPFGTVGAAAAIGAVFLIHIAFVGFILGATALAPFMEVTGLRRGGDPMYLRYARKLAGSIVYLYSFGATWAVFAVVLLTGLYGNLMGTLLNVLLVPLTIAFASFFVGIPRLLVYVYRWDHMAPRWHVAVGFAFAAVQYVFLVTIVELDSYALTPGSALAGRALFSPSYPWLLLHYAAANISWAALLLAAVAIWRGRRATAPAEIAYQRWAARINFAIGAAFLLTQPLTGFLLAATIKSAALPAFDSLFLSGSAAMFLGQVGLLAILVLGANVVFWRHNEAAKDGVQGAALTAVALVGMAGTALPAAILPPGLVALRYLCLLVAFLATGANLVRFVATTRRSGSTASIPAGVGQVITVVGVTALVLSLYMGVIKENAKLPCAIGPLPGHSACLMTLHAATQNFRPPAGTLP